MEEKKKQLTVGQYLLIFFIIIVVCCIINYDNITTTSSSEETTDFEIIESFSTLAEDNTYIISGKVKQKQEKNFDGIFISFIMYDSNNKKVRSTSMNISNYLGDGVWEFEAYGNDADKIVTSYKLDYIRGY